MTIDKLVEAGSDAIESDPKRAETLLLEALRRDPTNAPALFDLGLIAKQRRDWLLSIKYFRRLSTVIDDLITSDPQVDVGDERPEWWNIGIAATALHDWDLAREAWVAYGIELSGAKREITEDFGLAPIRVFNDDGEAEVVWGRRICPTRARLVNVPFRTSGHHYGDIVLHDGAPNGERVYGETTYPVFDEIEVWSRSGIATVVVSIAGFRGEEDRRAFSDYLDRIEIPHEDWSNVRMLCRECSEGTPSAGHSHEPASADGIFGFAASVPEVTSSLEAWARDHPAFVFTMDLDDQEA